LGRLIGAFKTVSTKQINQLRATPGQPVWQRNYYEHVIRNEIDLEEIREYIQNNTLKWLEDENHPNNIKK
jgi:REP element-mobilizing transposase RayT